MAFLPSVRVHKCSGSFMGTSSNSLASTTAATHDVGSKDNARLDDGIPVGRRVIRDTAGASAGARLLVEGGAERTIAAFVVAVVVSPAHEKETPAPTTAKTREERLDVRINDMGYFCSPPGYRTPV